MSSNPRPYDIVLKGTGALALRANASRRRTKAEIREEKLQKAAHEANIDKKLLELEELKKIQKQNATAMSNAQKTMSYLFNEGLLKTTGVEGEVVPVVDFEEFQHFREMKALEAQSQGIHQPSQIQNEGGQIAMGSSLVDGEDSVMTAQENNYAGPSFLPGAERGRAPNQLEEMEEPRLNVQDFMKEDDEDAYLDKRGGSQDGLLQ